MFHFISLITRFYQFYYFYPYTNLYQFTRCATSGSKLKTTFHSTCSTTATRGTLAPFVVRSSTPQQIFPSTWSSTSHRGMSVWSAGKNTTTERVWPNTRKVTSVRLMGRGEVGVRSSVKFETCWCLEMFVSTISKRVNWRYININLLACFRSKPTSVEFFYIIWIL